MEDQLGSNLTNCFLGITFNDSNLSVFFIKENAGKSGESYLMKFASHTTISICEQVDIIHTFTSMMSFVQEKSDGWVGGREKKKDRQFN